MNEMHMECGGLTPLSISKPRRLSHAFLPAGWKAVSSHRTPCAAAVHLVLMLTSVGFAADKSQYHLFNPTPRELMREMSTDRPDKTESPHTVDAGHYQIEMDIFNYAVDRYNGIPGDHRSESFAIAPVNFKAGLLNNVDLQVVVESYISLREKNVGAGEVHENRGFGDVIPRLKVNLWGNDGGATALAVMPYVKLPTNTDHVGNNSVEGGLIVPFGVSLPHDWGMTLMTQFDINRDEDGDGHHPEFVNSIAVGRGIIGNLGGYLEFFSVVSTESGSEWIGTVDCGLTYALTEDIQLDGGVNVGVTRSADDVNPFLGLSWRF